MRRIGYSLIKEALPNIKDGFLVQFIFNKKPANPKNIKEDVQKDIFDILKSKGLLLS